MKQVSLTLYTFDELTPEVQNKVIDRERFNIMDRQMEISNSSFRKTLAKFEQFFSTSVFNWEVDYCGFTYRYKINEIDAYCFDYVRKDGEEVFGEFPLEELSGKLLRRYINNNIVPSLFTRKFYWNGRSKSRHSRIIRNCVCPLTGDVTDTSQFLEYLAENNILRHLDGKYYWMEEELPSAEISLRSARTENFVIVDVTDAAHHRVIGEMDRYTVPMLLHENAIYLHDARMYQVEKLDLDHCKAFIRATDVDYYTDADLNVSLHILDDLEQKQLSNGSTLTLGELRVSTIVKMFKKFKLDTNEPVGFGEVRLPQTDLHTVGMWWTLTVAMALRYTRELILGVILGVSHLLYIVEQLYLMCST